MLQRFSAKKAIIGKNENAQVGPRIFEIFENSKVDHGALDAKTVRRDAATLSHSRWCCEQECVKVSAIKCVCICCMQPNTTEG
jgi:hypothetical protein